jgi:hypothetical protein
MSSRLLVSGVSLALSLTAPSSGEEAMPSAQEIGAIQVYLTPAEGRARAFPAAVDHEPTVFPVSVSLRAEVQARLGRPFAADSVAVYIARASDGTTLGYTVVADEIGKYRPITFLVAATPDLLVASVAILVYRESRGGEVRRSRFLRQYRGKDADDPIRINRDIVNITGATMSVRALNVGVRRVLLLLESFLR